MPRGREGSGVVWVDKALAPDIIIRIVVPSVAVAHAWLKSAEPSDAGGQIDITFSMMLMQDT